MPHLNPPSQKNYPLHAYVFNVCYISILRSVSSLPSSDGVLLQFFAQQMLLFFPIWRFLSCALFSFLLFVVNILRTAFFSFPLFVSFISYAFSSLFEYCDRIKHIACFLLCLISKLLSTSVCSSLYLFLALESSALFFSFWILADCQFNIPRTVQTIPFDYCISISFNRFFLVLPQQFTYRYSFHLCFL